MDRLREFEQVTINLPREAARASERDFDCAVLAFDRATAMLRPLDALPAGLARTLPHVTMLFEHGGGVVGLNGVFILDPPYVLFTVEDGIQLPRRRSTRAPLALPVTLRHDAGEYAGVTVNVAAEGLLVEVEMPAEADDAVVALMQLPAGAVEIAGRVVRAGEDNLVAVALDHGPASVRAALMQLVLAAQTALLRERMAG